MFLCENPITNFNYCFLSRGVKKFLFVRNAREKSVSDMLVKDKKKGRKTGNLSLEKLKTIVLERSKDNENSLIISVLEKVKLE